MQPGGTAPAEDPAARLTASAKGWHSIQLAVLGFIGICGVLRSGGDALPQWLRVLTAVLAFGALGLAVLAILVVGRVAYPLHGVAPGGVAPGGAAAGGAAPSGVIPGGVIPGGVAPDGAALAISARQLRGGIRVTILALTAIVVAAISGWWPTASSGAADSAGGASTVVEVRDAAGRRLCGELVAAPEGTVRIRTPQGMVTLLTIQVEVIGPVETC